MTEDDTKRVVLARVREWNAEIGSWGWFDAPSLVSTDTDVAVDALIHATPEAALDHG